MKDRNSILDLLPSSEKVASGPRPVSNWDLIPIADPLKAPPVTAPTSGYNRASELLGSGSKIPESYESRMVSQLPVQDISRILRKEQTGTETKGAVNSSSDQNCRASGYGCAPYRSENRQGYDGGSYGEPKGSSSSEKQLRAKIAEEKAIAKEHKRLSDQKAYLLSYCNSGNVTPGSSEAYIVLGQVSDINRQLGLPSSHFGNWKVPV